LCREFSILSHISKSNFLNFTLIKTFLLFISVLVFAYGANGQKIDSLKKALRSSQGVDRYEILFGLAYEYSDVNDSLSLVYAEQAYDLALNLGDSARIIKGGRIKAGELRRLENIDEAIQVAEYVLGIARRLKNTSELKLILTSVATSYSLKAEFDKALKYNFESLVIREAEGNRKEISISLNNIGLTYYRLNDLTRSLQYYKKSLELKRSVNDKHDLDRLLINMGLCLNASGDYAEARKYVNEGLKECDGTCSDQITLEGQYALGISFFETKSYTESLAHFEKSYEVAKRVNNYRFQGENLLHFAKLHLINKDYAPISKYLLEAEQISIQRGYGRLLISTYELFSKLYKTTGDYQNTALYQAKYIALKDSIYSEKLMSNLAQVQTAYQERENLKTIDEKNQVLALQKEIIVRQQRQYFFIFTITCLAVSLALVLFYFSKRQQKVNRELSLAKNKIQEQNKSLESHNKELEDRVEERTRDLNLTNQALSRANSSLQQVNSELDNFIYKTSHDIRGPLATLRGICNLAMIEVSDEVAITYLKRFDVTAEHLSIILTRLAIVNQINNSVLVPASIDFQEILDEIVSYEKKKGLPAQFSITYEIEPDCALISDRTLVKIILENLIDNAIKFRNTSDRQTPYAKINLKKQGNHVDVTVKDNGIGISMEEKNVFQMFMRASELSQTGGVGLYLTRLATEKIGGKISLIHSDTRGSIFQARFPSNLNDVIRERSREEQKLIEQIEKQSDRATDLRPR